MKNLTLALKINAVFSALSGIVLILFNQDFAHIFGVQNNTSFWIIGILLLLFSISVYMESRKNPKRTKQIKIIIFQDILWVLGSLVIIIFGLFDLSKTGYIIIGEIALIVAFFAVHQSYALKKYAT